MVTRGELESLALASRVLPVVKTLRREMFAARAHVSYKLMKPLISIEIVIGVNPNHDSDGNEEWYLVESNKGPSRMLFDFNPPLLDT